MLQGGLRRRLIALSSRLLILAAIAAGAVAGSSAPVLAHATNAAGAGFASGIAHPFSGLDHMLAMVAVGLWAFQLGRRAAWLLPLTFPAVMALGALFGAGGMPLPGVETGIAGSVVVLGATVAFALRPPLAGSIGLIGLFALFHGHGHGSELPVAASPLFYGAGFILSTLFLHLCGLGLGAAFGTPVLRLALRGSGAAIAAAGMALLVVA